MSVLKEVLSKEGYGSSEEIVKDWEFSLNAMKWWEKKVKELQSPIQGT